MKPASQHETCPVRGIGSTKEQARKSLERLETGEEAGRAGALQTSGMRRVDGVGRDQTTWNSYRQWSATI